MIRGTIFTSLIFSWYYCGIIMPLSQQQPLRDRVVPEVGMINPVAVLALLADQSRAIDLDSMAASKLNVVI